MRKLQLCFLAALMGILTGCGGVVSLHPLALPNDRDAIFDPALIGTWEGTNAEQTRYVVARAESGYTVTIQEGPDSGVPNRNAEYSMRLVKVGERRLLDFYTKNIACDNGDCDNSDMRLDVHLFFKIRLDKDSAWLTEMDSDWLKEQIKTKGLLRHEVLAEDGDRVVLTASPSELRQNLLPLVADDRSFGEESELRRVK